MRKINLGCLLHLISGQGLATKIRSGWRSVESRNLTGGVVALHRAIRPA